VKWPCPVYFRSSVDPSQLHATKDWFTKQHRDLPQLPGNEELELRSVENDREPWRWD